MLDKDNWEENKDEAKGIAQTFIYDEKRKSECIKYFTAHFKISQATAYRWYEKIYNELSIPSIDKATKLAEYKASVEDEIERTTRTFKLGSKQQEHNLIDALKIACRKFSKEKTGKKPYTNINIVKI